jgi:nicotinamidase-related amidase
MRFAGRRPRKAVRLEQPMSENEYPREATAVLLVDPYNDMLSEGGIVWPRLKEVAEEVGLLANLRAIRSAAKAARVRIFIVPHHQWEESDYVGWQHLNPSQRGTRSHRVFAKGTWGGEFHSDFAPEDGDIVVQQHWAQSGFANTDLDMQLKQHGISHVVVIGLIANTCIESTARYGMELGYHVTLVRDATAASTRETMRAAHEVNGPTFAHAIVTTKELIAALQNCKN